ncbi:MAG: hypothetical protein CM1200mP27_00580 [Chloroflexota bacterium]|nr:MAG: hypothetical protein CM1200mP27_00580 [Chloroflexota bacterium]
MTQAGISVHVGAFFLDRGLTLTAAANAITINAAVNALASLIWGAIIERITVRLAMTGDVFSVQLVRYLCYRSHLRALRSW